MSPEVEQELTAEQVLAYGAELRAWAAGINNPDPGNSNHRPYARVWSPTLEYCRYLVRKYGPTEAMRRLEALAEAAKRQLEFDAELDKAKEDRERKRRERERRDADDLAGKEPPGVRIDRALAQLSMIAGGKTAKMEAQVQGGIEHPSRLLAERNDEEHRKALIAALGLARRLENTLDRLRRSPLPPPKLADRDAQLKAFLGYTPEQIAQLDPRQGLPRQIRERRDALGLDQETGDQVAA
jgi:hypothetical protein